MVYFQKDKISRFIMSLALSLLVWIYVTNMDNPIQTKTFTNVPISYLNVEGIETQNLAVDSDKTPTESVTVQGRYSDISEASISDISASIDFKDLAVKEGINTISLNVESTNNKIEIVKEKTPTQIKVDIEKLIQKEFYIVTNGTGNINPQYVNLDPVLSKNKVLCSGTKSTIDSIEKVVAFIDLTGATKDISKTVELIPINKFGEKVEHIVLKDRAIDVSVPIKFKKEVPITLNISSYPNNGYKIEKYSLDKKNITIVGDKSVLDEITSISTEPLDFTRRYYDFEKRVKLSLPDGVSTSDNSNTIYVSFEISN